MTSRDRFANHTSKRAFGDVILSCESVSRVSRRLTGDIVGLTDIDLEIERARLTVLSGPSGSGKSSLLRILGGVDRPTSGQVLLSGVGIGEMSAHRRRRMRRKYIGFVLQRPSDNLISYLSAADHVLLSAELRGSARDQAMALLDALGLGERHSNKPPELSGGEQQRLAFAQAGVGDPRILLADEPTSELDARSADTLVDHVRSLAARGTAVVIATHDPMIADRADRVIRMQEGRIVDET